MKESAVVFGDLKDPASRVAAVGRHARGRALVPLRIGELAADTQVTRDTLRYYERLGLLTTPTRTSGGFSGSMATRHLSRCDSSSRLRHWVSN